MPPADKVLIVENNPLIAAAIEKAGEQFHMRADVATDGWDAIEKLRTENYRAIFIDTELPRHSGYGVLTWLRQENGEELDNVILVTDCDEDDMHRRVGERVRILCRTDDVSEIAALLTSSAE
jgi:DNA-binding response OmpR family regulator